MRKSKHIFYDLRQKKDITVPMQKNKSREDQTLSVFEINSVQVQVLLKVKSALATQREERQREAKGIIYCDCITRQQEKRGFFLHIFLNCMTLV